MSVHPDGSGTGWTNVEAVDIDQPHGKDYLYSQHIAKGVRKRSNKEHEAYGDTTAGGEHLAGGCRILGIVDATADLTKGAGDASIDITQGIFLGRGIIYDQTSNVLWCYTADGSTTDDPYALMMGPESICEGADYTWTANHAFQSGVDFSAVDISDSLDLTGALACGSTATITNLLTCSSKAKIVNDISCNAGLEVDGTVLLNANVIVDGTFTFGSGAVFNHFGDWSGRAMDTTYTAATDGEVYIAIRSNGASRIIIGSTPHGTTRQRFRLTGAADEYDSFSMKVKKGNTWSISGDTTTYTESTVSWLPYGDNT